MQQDAIFLIAGVLLGGVIGGITLFLGYLTYTWWMRPVLNFDENRVREIRISVPSPTQRVETVYVTSLKIKNDGKNAALNCKGKLQISDNSERVCWSIPSERREIAINCEDFEFLDVCGWQVTNSERIAPTENDWQPFGKNRRIGEENIGNVKAKIIITSSNAKHIEMDIVIKTVGSLKNRSDPLFSKM